MTTCSRIYLALCGPFVLTRTFRSLKPTDASVAFSSIRESFRESRSFHRDYFSSQLFLYSFL